MHLLDNVRALRQSGRIRYLERFHHRFVVRHSAVSGALDEMDTGNGWQALQFIHREDERPVHNAMDHEAVLAGINVRKASTAPRHEMESGRRDDSRRILKRRQSLAHLARRQAVNNVTWTSEGYRANGILESRTHAVGKILGRVRFGCLCRK